MVLLSTQDAEDLHKCKKWIYDNIQWEPRGKSQYFEVVVITQMGENLMLRGTKARKYSFALLYRNSKPIRKWDYKHIGEERKNLDGTKILIPNNCGHKHKWDEITEDVNNIYIVDDIPIDNLQEAFFKFLKEENIEFKGYFQFPLS